MKIAKFIVAAVLIFLGVIIYLNIRDEIKLNKFKEEIRDYAKKIETNKPATALAEKLFVKGPFAIWVTGESFRSIPGLKDAFDEGGIYSIERGKELSIKYLIYVNLEEYAEKSYQFERYVSSITQQDTMYNTGKTSSMSVKEYGALVAVIDLGKWEVIAENKFVPTKPPRTYPQFQSGGVSKQILTTPEEISYRVMDDVERWANEGFRLPIN